MDPLTSPNGISKNSFLILCCVVLFLVYWFRKTFNYWSDRGVTQVPLVINIDIILRRHTIGEVLRKLYVLLDGHRFGGCYEFTRPALLIRDPKLVGTILVKEFHSFRDHTPPLDHEAEPLSSNLFQLTGERWSRTRKIVSSAFSAAKMKAMFPHMEATAGDLKQFLERSIEATEEVDIKDAMSRFSTDVIGACALGIRNNSFTDENSELRRVLRKYFTFDWRRTVHGILQIISPKIAPFLKFTAAPTMVQEFFFSLFRSTVQQRRQEAMKGKLDFFKILVDLKTAERKKLEATKRISEEAPAFNNESSKESEVMLTDTTVVAIVSAFLFVNIEVISSALSLLIYELALHPDIQEKLFCELELVREKNGGNIGYQELSELKYMECVIKELLRKYPVVTNILRRCSTRFQIPDSSVCLEAGTSIFIPILAIHRDPKYFPNPEIFDPDRFKAENIGKIQPNTYLPFGDGPRFCIAKRFSSIEIKAMLAIVVSNFIILSTARTPKSIRYSPVSLTLSPEDAIWLQFQKRENSIS